MSAQLSHRETRALFIAFADEDLPVDKAREVKSHLDGCGDCLQGWQRYESTLQRLKGVERHRAPAALSSQVLARVKRQRRSGLRRLTQLHAHYRLPVEIIIPVLLAAAVAAYLLLSPN